MATARIGRRRRHKLHKRVATIRARVHRWCSHASYDFDRCAIVLVPRHGGDTKFAISEYAIYAAAPPLLMRERCAMKGYHCEGCASQVIDPSGLEVVQRASGCRLWLCHSCRRTTLALGTKPADVPAEVARDREAYAGGARIEV